MSCVAIGDLRHPLVLEAPERTDTAGGDADTTWREVATVMAAITPKLGREFERSDAMTGDITLEITIRYRAGITPGHRFRDGTRIFDITSVIDVDARRRWLRCACKEHQA